MRPGLFYSQIPLVAWCDEKGRSREDVNQDLFECYPLAFVNVIVASRFPIRPIQSRVILHPAIHTMSHHKQLYFYDRP
jgi:hypothetical protein